MGIVTTQDGRLLKLSTPLGKDFLLIERLRCREGLNQLFSIELDILHEEQAEGFNPTVVDPDKLLGKPMSVEVEQPGSVKRYFNGICIRFAQGGRNQRFSGYSAEVVPKVWLMTQVTRSRIFQNKTVPQILEEVFEGYDVDFEIRPQGMKPRNYCVQYRESDWDFASRLMEDEGIYHYFEHTADNHRLILANTAPSHRKIPSVPKLKFALQRPELQEGWIPSVYEWRFDDMYFTGKYELRDHNFQLPRQDLRAQQTSQFDIGKNRSLERYDYPGYYAKRFDGIDPGGGEDAGRLSPVFEDRERTVKIRQEELDAQYKRIFATSDCSALTAGYRFALGDHPTKSNNRDHVVVTAEHRAVQSPYYIPDVEMGTPYDITFSCMPHGSGQPPFRPERKTPHPVVRGTQTAIVVGPPGEEIFTDKFGRVKVQFHWDRLGKNDINSSCWIRVGTLWAGKQWGVIHIPRIGHEVIVDFIEGDPDQPIIVGSVYNPDTMPPYTLPDHKTQSGVKSRSSKGGSSDNFNEFRFEDLKGEEEVYLHAEKNNTIMVENDEMTTVIHNRTELVGSGSDKETITIQGFREETVTQNETITVQHDRTHTVGDNQVKTVGKNETITVGQDRSHTVKWNQTRVVGKNETTTVGENRKHDTIGDQTKSVGKNDSLKVGRKMSAEVGDSYTLTATNLIDESSKKIEIKAGVELILTGPGGQIKIDSGGVTITGVLVKIN